MLTQARPELIERTYEALRGMHRAIVHVYNSTSPVQREQVFKASKEEIIAIAVNGARLLQEHAARHAGCGVDLRILSGELFGNRTGLRGRGMQRSARRLAAAEGRGVVINLPATVEMTLAERVRRPGRVFLPACHASRAYSRQPAHS